jgi:hypothetical protein
LENDDNAPDQVASECNKTGIWFTLKKVATGLYSSLLFWIQLIGIIITVN